MIQGLQVDDLIDDPNEFALGDINDDIRHDRVMIVMQIDGELKWKLLPKIAGTEYRAIPSAFKTFSRKHWKTDELENLIGAYPDNKGEFHAVNSYKPRSKPIKLEFDYPFVKTKHGRKDKKRGKKKKSTKQTKPTYYVTRTGKKYHLGGTGCRYLSSANTVKQEELGDKKLCAVCARRLKTKAL